MCRDFIEPFALVEVQVLANLVAANHMVPHLMITLNPVPCWPQEP
jgi:hypothetical protein